MLRAFSPNPTAKNKWDYRGNRVLARWASWSWRSTRDLPVQPDMLFSQRETLDIGRGNLPANQCAEFVEHNTFPGAYSVLLCLCPWDLSEVARSFATRWVNLSADSSRWDLETDTSWNGRSEEKKHRVWQP